MSSRAITVLLCLALVNDAVSLPAKRQASGINVQLGPRPEYLVNNMDDGALKDSLLACSEGPFSTSQFSISHRGAPLMFPEHSREGYMAAARMGAGQSVD